MPRGLQDQAARRRRKAESLVRLAKDREGKPEGEIAIDKLQALVDKDADIKRIPGVCELLGLGPAQAFPAWSDPPYSEWTLRDTTPHSGSFTFGSGLYTVHTYQSTRPQPIETIYGIPVEIDNHGQVWTERPLNEQKLQAIRELIQSLGEEFAREFFYGFAGTEPQSPEPPASEESDSPHSDGGL